MSLPPKPNYDLRLGTSASLTARLVIVAMICGFQYWLLTVLLEATSAGNTAVALPGFLASLLCLVLVAGLIVTGEAGLRGGSEPE